MDKTSMKTAMAIALIIVGIAVLAIFNWNVFALDLLAWAKIPSTIVGIPYCFRYFLIPRRYLKKR